MSGAILTLNAGSSSIKFCVFEMNDEALARGAEGQIDGIGVAPQLKATTAEGSTTERRWDGGAQLSHEALLGSLLDWAESHLGRGRLCAIGHRIVHGGAEFHQPMRLDQGLLGPSSTR